MNMKDTIARIVSLGFMLHRHSTETADAIIAALPDLYTTAIAERDDLQARVIELEAVVQSITTTAYATLNPANYSHGETQEEIQQHIQKTLQEIADTEPDIDILERVFGSQQVQLTKARNDALDEVAKVADEWANNYDKGLRLLSRDIRALKTEPTKGLRDV
jgi:hypothetical protein